MKNRTIGDLCQNLIRLYSRCIQDDAVHNAITGLFTGGLADAVGGALRATQYNEDAEARQDLLNKVISDAQYEDASKEW